MFSNSGIKHADLLLCHTNLLLRLQSDFNKEICNIVFDDLSDHLFDKWLKTDRNILNFFSQLDIKNRKKLLKWAWSRT
jgi:hypothetical protein